MYEEYDDRMDYGYGDDTFDEVYEYWYDRYEFTSKIPTFFNYSSLPTSPGGQISRVRF